MYAVEVLCRVHGMLYNKLGIHLIEVHYSTLFSVYTAVYRLWYTVLQVLHNAIQQAQALQGKTLFNIPCYIFITATKSAKTNCLETFPIIFDRAIIIYEQRLYTKNKTAFLSPSTLLKVNTLKAANVWTWQCRAQKNSRTCPLSPASHG